MFACIYVPDFPVEAIVRAEPCLRTRAVAVLEGKSPLTRVVALNERGRDIGLEIGMTKLQAAPFAEKTDNIERGRCDHLPSALAVLRQRSPAQETSAHMALLDVAHAFTPRVEDSAGDTVLLDLAGMERMYGTAERMGSELARRVAAFGIEANIAIAANPDAALHAARGFKRITIISPSQEAERLGELPIHILFDAYEITSIENIAANAAAQREFTELRTQMLDTLERWGIRDFRALGQLPEHSLSSRLGTAGAKLRRLALGQGTRTLVLCEPPSQFEEAMELEFPVETIESLSFVLNRLLEQLCARLEARALAVQELRMRLQLERQIADEDSTAVQELRASSKTTALLTSVFERTFRLPVPMRDAKVFLKLLQLDLAANSPGASVVKIWIGAEPTAPRSAQRGLFLPITPEAEKLEITLARINAVVGAHRAGIAQLLDTHRPDGFHMERFFATNPSNRQKECKEIKKQSALSVRRIRPPCRLRVQLSEGRPRTLSPEMKQSDRAGLQGTIVWSAGPWRSSGEWWADGPKADESQGELSATWDREEWDVALLHSPKNGAHDNLALYRIYRDIASDCWFAEASYD